VALGLAVEFLRTVVGVPLGRLLPYSIQLVLLTACFHVAPDPSDAQLAALRRWFWATSWNGYFAGANTTQVKNALAEMRRFARGEVRSLEAANEKARPFPDRFDMRSARIRSLILWQLRELTPLGVDEKPLNVVDIIEKADIDAFRHVVVEGSGLVSSPANRVVLPTPPGISVRRALSELPADSPVAMSHGITEVALTALRCGNLDGFIQKRVEYMAEREREFMGSLSVSLPSSEMGPDVIDTE
jgi:hypothetical protein